MPRLSVRHTLAAGVAVAIAFALILVVSFTAEGDRRLVTGNRYGDQVEVHATVVAVDAEARELTVRLQFTPKGRYVDELTGRLALPLEVFLFNVRQKSQQRFERAELMSPVDLTIGLTDGEPTSYPFDTYEATMFFLIARTDDRGRLGCDTEEVPTQLRLSYAIHPYSISAGDGERLRNRCFDSRQGRYVPVHGEQTIDLDLSRALTTKAFSVFVMVLMWALAVASVATAIVLTRWKREIGAGVLGFLAALLFALPAVRSVLPGTPPLGALIDYLAFFWAEAVIAITFCFVAVRWLQSEMRSGAPVRARRGQGQDS